MKAKYTTLKSSNKTQAIVLAVFATIFILVVTFGDMS